MFLSSIYHLLFPPQITDTLVQIISVPTWTRPFCCWWQRFVLHWTDRHVFAFTSCLSCLSYWYSVCRSEQLGSSCRRLVRVHQNATQKVTQFILQMQIQVCLSSYFVCLCHMPVHKPWNYNAYLQGNLKVSVHLTITIQEVTTNVQSVPRQCNTG
jgi:subtilase family serine protease